MGWTVQKSQEREELEDLTVSTTSLIFRFQLELR